jgi:hypothetical protein
MACKDKEWNGMELKCMAWKGNEMQGKVRKVKSIQCKEMQGME